MAGRHARLIPSIVVKAFGRLIRSVSRFEHVVQSIGLDGVASEKVDKNPLRKDRAVLGVSKQGAANLSRRRIIFRLPGFNACERYDADRINEIVICVTFAILLRSLLPIKISLCSQPLTEQHPSVVIAFCCGNFIAQPTKRFIIANVQSRTGK